MHLNPHYRLLRRLCANGAIQPASHSIAQLMIECVCIFCLLLLLLLLLLQSAHTFFCRRSAVLVQTVRGERRLKQL